MRKEALSLVVGNRMTLTLFAALLVGMVALFGLGIRTAETQTSSPTTYEVTDLGPVCTTNPTTCGPWGINDSEPVGAVVGQSSSDHAFLKENGQSMKDLGTLGGLRSTAYSINGSAQVVGRSDTTGQASSHAFLYPDPNSPSPQMKDLGTAAPNGAVGFTPVSTAYGINVSGQVAASSDAVNTLPRVTHAFLYTISDGAWKDLGALFIAPSNDQSLRSFLFSEARGINDSGINASAKVVGFSRIMGGATHAFLYPDLSCVPPAPPPGPAPAPNTCMQDLGTINYAQGLDCDPSNPLLICDSFAYGINGSGQVVGKSQIASPNSTSTNKGLHHAFLYPDAASPAQMKDLGTLGDDSESEALAINDSGVVVGRSGDFNGGFHPFLYDSSSDTPQMQDLNDLCAASTPCSPNFADGLWTLSEARAINNAGQIAATGAKFGVGNRALLLTPSDPNTPPATPSTPDLDAASDSGSSSTDNITNDVTPTFTGTADAGSTVKIYVDGVENGSGTATGGNYSVITTNPLGPGNHSITAKASNGSAESGASQALNITIDSLAPPAPTITSPKQGSTIRSPFTVKGRAEIGTTVALFDGTPPSPEGTATAGGRRGTWSITVSEDVAGAHSYNAQATDGAGNTSELSALTVTVRQRR